MIQLQVADQISQARLAEILELQKEHGEIRKELTFKWDELRRDLERGARVEPGPIIASLETYSGDEGEIGVKLVVR